MSADPAAKNAAPSYLMGHSEFELRRLEDQARLIDPITRRFFDEAGIGPGMRVLDVGSGAGDVAFLGAGLVGDSGEVVGVDRAPAALATARRRAAERSLRNVTFEEGDPSVMKFAKPFDAVTGRYVLMFQPDPAATLRRLAAHVRPGGVLVFHEPDWLNVGSDPPAPTWDQCCEWIRETARRSGADDRMGVRLHSTFLKAGLPAPAMRCETCVAGADDPSYRIDLLVDVAGAILPEMERLGVATAAELDYPTLAKRVRAEAKKNGSVLIGRMEIGAWANVPG